MPPQRHRRQVDRSRELGTLVAHWALNVALVATSGEERGTDILQARSGGRARDETPSPQNFARAYDDLLRFRDEMERSCDSTTTTITTTSTTAVGRPDHNSLPPPARSILYSADWIGFDGDVHPHRRAIISPLVTHTAFYGSSSDVTSEETVDPRSLDSVNCQGARPRYAPWDCTGPCERSGLFGCARDRWA